MLKDSFNQLRISSGLLLASHQRHFVLKNMTENQQFKLEKRTRTLKDNFINMYQKQNKLINKTFTLNSYTDVILKYYSKSFPHHLFSPLRVEPNGGGAHLLSQHSAGRGKWISVRFLCETSLVYKASFQNSQAVTQRNPVLSQKNQKSKQVKRVELEMGMGTHTYKLSTLEDCGIRTLSSRSVWTTKQVIGQPGLHNKTIYPKPSLTESQYPEPITQYKLSDRGHYLKTVQL